MYIILLYFMIVKLNHYDEYVSKKKFNDPENHYRTNVQPAIILTFVQNTINILLSHYNVNNIINIWLT